MSKKMTPQEFDTLRAENPGATPAALFDMACVKLSIPRTWETAGWFSCSIWMDAFANAPTSYLAH